MVWERTGKRLAAMATVVALVTGCLLVGFDILGDDPGSTTDRYWRDHPINAKIYELR